MNAKVDITNTILETERLILRPWRKSDLKDLYEYARVDGVGQMAGWEPHKSIEESEFILSLFMEGKHVFALELKENRKVIGSLGLEEACVSMGEEYEKLTGREIGYVLSKDYWGRGLMPEAVKRVIEYCFENEKYDFLQCCHAVTNGQSGRVIEKCGFRYVKDNTDKDQNGNERISRCYVLDNTEKRG